MTSIPLISVVLPLYNAEKYIRQAIQSILAQSFQDWELIIVDDASTDRSALVVQSVINARISLIRHSENGGYPVAMNTGISQAKGKYIARMDADDVSAPTRLEKQIAFLTKHEEYCFVATRRYSLTPNGKRIDTDPVDVEFLVETCENLMDGTRVFTDASVLVERGLVERVGGYRTYQRAGMDMDLWFRILELGRPMATLTEPLYGRRLLPNEITFKQGATASYQLPKFLALERQENGADKIMRHEFVEITPPQSILEHANAWRLSALWNTSIKCVSVGDLTGSWIFVRDAMRSSDLNIETVKWLAKYILQLVKVILHLKKH
jgi:glycosyltransferase involved in cell wall biosynthesis